MNIGYNIQAVEYMFTVKSIKYRGVAKFGIALGSGPRGHGFESRHSDHEKSHFCLPTKVTFFNDIRSLWNG